MHKCLVILSVLFFLTFFVLPSQLKAEGINHEVSIGEFYNAAVTAESVSNISGGEKTGSIYNILFNYNLSYNLGVAGISPGTRVFFSVYALYTKNPELFVGDIQGVSNITAPYSQIRLYRFGLSKKLGNFTFRLGLLNANDYFDVTGAASKLINASYGIYPILTINFPGFPAYPNSTLGIMVKYSQNGLRFKGGIFGGDGIHPFAQPFSRGNVGLLEIDKYGDFAGTSYTAKIGYFRYSQLQKYREILGQNCEGIYGVLEDGFTMSGYGKLRFFLQGGSAPNSLNPVPRYLGLGLKLKRFYDYKDTITLGMGKAWLNNTIFNVETDYELNYGIALSKKVYFQPDIQYIFHPGGIYPRAFVGILRFTENF